MLSNLHLVAANLTMSPSCLALCVGAPLLSKLKVLNMALNILRFYFRLPFHFANRHPLPLAFCMNSTKPLRCFFHKFCYFPPLSFSPGLSFPLYSNLFTFTSLFSREKNSQAYFRLPLRLSSIPLGDFDVLCL